MQKGKNMKLEDAGVINTRTLNALKKKNIFTVNDLACYFPRKYLDYRRILPLSEAVEKDCAICGYLETYEKKEVNGKTVIGADVIEESSGEVVHVKWYGQSWQFNDVKKFSRQEVVICGKVKYHVMYGYNVTNPTSYHLKSNFKGKIIPIYTKIKNISDDMLKKSIDKCIELITEPLPDVVFNITKLMDYKTAVWTLHHPYSDEEISVQEILEPAEHRLIFNQVLYFTLALKLNNSKNVFDSKETFRVASVQKSQDFLHMLPYKLTYDQENACNQILKQMKAGQKVNMLVQGDVGCGKTTIAFLAMILMAENGYQSVLMAPTTVLAKQHYEELCSYGDRLGFKTVLLSSDLKGSEKKKVENDISEGNYQFIVGTHSVFSKSTSYKKLGLVITDEEHRFGVKQREALQQKAQTGVHIISMSATPIPRTLADILYGEEKQLVTIKTLPNGRKPVQTAVNRSDEKIFDFVAKQLNQGRQAYIVCPAIEENEAVETVKMESVEETEIKYRERFEPYGVKVGVVTGKQDKTEAEKTITAFKENKIQILVSTTVIEVGVNVPNATVIVINNAERFGLAQLHQLRGRVGRGNYSSYCILKSDDRYNERLVTMERTTDGFEIAKEDLKQRGLGDLIGTAQSGNNRYMDLVIAMPNLYNCIKKYAVWMINENMYEGIIQLYKKEEGSVNECE